MDKSQVQDGILKRTDHPTAREHLASFFKQLGKIRSNDDDPILENELEEYVNNDSDGVACQLASDLENIQQKKLSQLLKAHSEIFPTDEKPAMSSPITDINARGKWGYTRLTDASVKGNLELVKQLVEAGASWDIPDNGGQTAWDKANTRGFDEILRVFDPDFVRTEPAPLLNFDDD